MTSEIDYAGGMFSAIKNAWSGGVLLLILFVFYSFYCLSFAVQNEYVNSEMLICLSPFVVLLWPLFNIAGAGCPGVFITIGILWTCRAFLREYEFKSKWGVILCILISIQGFLISLGGMTLDFAAVYVSCTMIPPLLFWCVLDRVRKHRLRTLELQADELEKQRLLGQRKIVPEEYRKTHDI